MKILNICINKRENLSKAQGLDVYGANVKEIIEKAKQEVAFTKQ